MADETFDPYRFRRPFFVEKGGRPHNLAGSAISALKGPVVGEGLAQIFEPFRETFDGHYSAIRLVDDFKAGQDRSAIDQHRTTAALTSAAGVFGACEAKLIAQYCKKGGRRWDRDC